MNTCMLIGFLKSEPVLMEGKGKDRYVFEVVSERPFREADGSVKRDVIRVCIWKGKAVELKETCRPGSFIVIKGRLICDESGSCMVMAESASAFSHHRILAACRKEGYDTMHV